MKLTQMVGKFVVREVVVKSIDLGFALLFSLFSFLAMAQTPTEEFLKRNGPINRDISVPGPTGWLLENPEGSHAKLWDPDFLKKNPPTKTENREVVIVGGGAAGLFSAYQIKDRDYLLLDQNPFLGGNSTGQEWKGVASETGASFISIPDKGDEVDVLLHQLNIADKFTVHEHKDNPVMVDKVRYTDIWDTGTNPQNKIQFNKLRDFYKDMAAGKKGATAMPNIPFFTAADRAVVTRLDKQVARARLEKIVGGPLDPVVEAVINHLVWSDNSATIDEAGAASVDNFLAADFGGIASFPGGNAYVMEAVIKNLLANEKDPNNKIKTSSLVRGIKVTQDGVDVTYIDAQGVVTLVHAKSVVFAGAKFIANAVIEGLEPERVKAIQSLKYRSFVTANIKVNKPTPKEKQFYDMYFFNSDIANIKDVQKQTEEQGATDVIGAFSDADTVLTFFYPLSYDGARSTLLAPGSEEPFKKKIMSQFNEIIGPDLGFTEKDVVDVLLERRGHPMILTEKGNYAKGLTDILRKPFKGEFGTNRVFFVNQDNWLLPAFETILTESKIQMKDMTTTLEKEKKSSKSSGDLKTSKKIGANKSSAPQGVCPFLAAQAAKVSR